MNEDAIKSATQRVSAMSNNNANRNFEKYDNFRAKVDAIVTLEDVENMNQLVTGAEELSNAINSALKGLSSSSKEYKTMSDLYVLIANKAKELSDENNDAAKNAKIISDIYKALEKNSGNMDKNTTSVAKKFLDTNNDILNTANEFKDIMKRSSETFGKNLSNNLKNIADDVIKLSNAFNLQKLVTGGSSIKDLQTMQGNVKISMNLDDSGFMGVQRELISQNKELVSTAGEAYLTFSDTTSYLSNIQDYSLKNYNQSTSLYKQITIGNRYLNLSNQSLSSMVKATNQMADDSYMNKQMAILSALGTDSGLSENISGIADFMSTNIAGVNARYNNGDEMIKESAAMYSVNEAYLGNNAGLANSLMAEIMNTNNYANLSDKTKDILNMSGMSHELQAMMASGNVDMDKIMMGIYSGMYNFSQKEGGMNTLEMYGLGDWATLADSYNRNRSEYESKVSSQLDLLKNVNVDEAQDMQEIEKLLGQNVNKTFFEKFSDKMFTMFGIQNQNWTQLNGYIQLIQTVVTGAVLANSIFQSAQQLGIKHLLNAIALKSGVSGGGLFSKIGGKISGMQAAGHMASGAKLLGGVGLVAGGLAMGISDAMKTTEYDGGALGGFFMGTSAKDRSAGENTVSILGNTAKYAAIGAGIGTIFPGIGTAVGAAVGAGAGLLTGVIGLFRNSVQENTDAVNENTKVYGESRDSIATSSNIATLFKAMKNKEGAGAIAYGASSGSTSNFGMGAGGYPWSVTSQFGPRTLSNGDSSYHNGIDFGIKTGTPIGSPVSGTVTSVSRDNRNTYPGGPKSAGSGIYIQGDNGILYQFWHLSSVGVNKGDKVGYKQTIGLSGNTGYSTGPHLHFGTKKGGSWVNPGAYINGGLFSPDGKVYTANIDSNTVPVNDSSAMVTLKKDDVFQYNQGGKGGVEIPEESNNQGLATSADIDRLIKVITELNNNQNDQKDFLRALAGKNTFVYGREG